MSDVCQYLQGDAVEVECGRSPVVAVWRRDQSTARLCDRHDRRAQRQVSKHPDAGWVREAV